MIDILRVNVAVPTVLADHEGERVYSAIAKQPVATGATLWLSTVNLAGDSQADLSVHGGPDKAVYAYPSEHLGPWEHDLQERLGPAAFGENLSTRRILEDEVGIGDLWRWDDAVLQPCQPRWPCFKLVLHRQRVDLPGRLRATGRTGWYLRVIEPGEVTVGSSIEVVARDPAGITIADAHAAMGDRHLERRDLVASVAHHPALADQWREPLLDRLARYSGSTTG